MVKTIIGNFKMNMTSSETSDYLDKFLPLVSDVKDTSIILCVPYTSIEKAVKKCKHSAVLVGAQNIHSEEKGAFTGEISGKMLKDIQAKVVLVGHSERRIYNKETDSIVNKKIFQALKNGLTVVLCIGETKNERENNKTFEVIEKQLRVSLKDLYANELKSIIIAYEPIWSIGTGLTASEQQIKEVCLFIRKILQDMFNEAVSIETKILYGGSVNNNNISKILKIKNIDGVLVGGASLIYEEFAKICKS